MTTRRLTLSGNRSEMGFLPDAPAEPETPPPVWTPAKNDFWKKPSRWQICMPKLRLFAKVLLAMLGLLVVLKVMNTKPPISVDPVVDPAVPPPPDKILTEHELTEITMEAAKREEWAWKDFPLHQGLVRGTSQFASCREDEPNCQRKPPQLVRYDGYKHLQEDPTDIIQCVGPRGVALNESDEDAIWAYPGIAHGVYKSVKEYRRNIANFDQVQLTPLSDRTRPLVSTARSPSIV